MAMLLIAAGLLAGLQTDTRCVTYPNGVTNCQSQAPLPPTPQATAPDMSGLLSLLMGSPEKRRAKKIGKLIAAGKCVEARDVALKAGDYVAAQYVNTNCRPVPAE